MQKHLKGKKLQSNDRLTMLNEYGSRQTIIPAEVKGRFRTWRTRIHFLLMVIFLALPWIRINGSQAVLFDIGNRRFELFGALFQSHDSPLFFFILAMFVLGLMLSTALWGRFWCGWACPQTVFIEAIYRRIEIWVEGNYINRRRLSQGPITAEKITKMSIKWFLFFVVSSIFAHSFIAYFSGSERLLQMMSGSPQENWTYFILVTGGTALLLFNFGWFREQFCIIACPYGRFQSVLMDTHSITVMYNAVRGEPRKSIEVPKEKQGDCVSCNRCVQVCPTGIDIRHGSQLECIACTACIDACDEIMTKVNKPTGLISYGSVEPRTKASYFRPRIVAYSTLFLVALSGLSYNLINHMSFNSAVLRASGAPYQMGSDNSVINHFKVNLHNQSHKPQIFEITVESILNVPIKLTQAMPVHQLGAGMSKEVHLFISLPQAAFDQSKSTPLRFKVQEVNSQESRVVDVSAVGPTKSQP
ncbi:MAG: cytochrome c oxidase accessory protein CcoG [Bdellovibrionales bacterium RIFCSPHIGHO2_01_FULL_40_29]|nr:MAG: cytochrome c oxidase accessory protein CcoG [Bdellovibrionales bacterium RIFCSPHIGHO2_01_FULL_40_29]OFZ32572.1 MAG: cytochrome c oxidase accessory protein CcoG [Bdellovibrionales bacterium RIFCSPHIGHO2_02_FULL_40_15]